MICKMIDNYIMFTEWIKVFEQVNHFKFEIWDVDNFSLSFAPNQLTCGLIVVDIDALKLQIGVAVVGAGRVDTVLVRDHLPELKWKLTMNTISDIDSKHTPLRYPMISNQSYACGFCVIINNVERADVPCTDLFWLELLTHPCTDVNGGGPCVRTWMSNQIPLFYMDINTYQCLNADAG